MIWPWCFHRVGAQLIGIAGEGLVVEYCLRTGVNATVLQAGLRAVVPIGRLIDSRQYLSKSVEIGDPLKWSLRTLPRRTETRSLPDLMFAAGFFIIDGLSRK